MRGVSGPQIVKGFLLVFSLVILTTSGCNPKRNPGDLIIGSNSSGPISIGDAIGGYTALYGVEYGHTDLNRSAPAKANKNLLLALFILTPNLNDWIESGGGSIGRPWYYRTFYNARWMDYYSTEFVRRDKDGYFNESSERIEFIWKFDGRKRMLTIAGKDYSFSPGEKVLVSLSRDWEPEVAVGKNAFTKLRVSTKYRNIILRCFLSVSKDVHNRC